MAIDVFVKFGVQIFLSGPTKLMVDYKRIHPKITDLPISSAKRIFQSLDDLLLHDKLDLSTFKTKLSDFVIGENGTTLKAHKPLILLHLKNVGLFELNYMPKPIL